MRDCIDAVSFRGEVHVQLLRLLNGLHSQTLTFPPANIVNFSKH